MMLNSLQQYRVWQYITSIRSMSFLLFIATIIILSPFHSATAQEMDDRNKWSIGLQAGVLTGNLPTVSATNTIVSRFNVENDYYLTAAFQLGYAISEYESLQLTLSRGEFSVFTEYEFWPNVIFKNQFYTANLSAQLDLRRLVETLPNRLDPYGSFGLGLMSSRNTVSPMNSQDTLQNDFSDDQSNDLAFLLTTGIGFDYSLTSRFSIFFQFNHNFLSTDIIDKNLAGEVLDNDFIQTTGNWSTYTSGFRLKFGRTKTRTQPDPQSDDFQIVSTINSDRLDELEEEESDLSDRSDENSSDEQNIDRNIAESDSTEIQASFIPEIPDSTVESETSEEISENETQIDQDESDTEINGMSEDDYDDDIMFVTQPRYGLMGIAVEEISGSFSLNLHSFSNHDEANDIIGQLNADGFRVITQIANVNGIEYFRVGVGQFETRNDARSAAEKLPEQYRNNYFIIQI